ncbi:RNA polymerase sigma factor [Brevibacillus sp. SYSU BS000544]|uniref:RNA polymerase sigma factor n=1 Tax=Brevibacillus sp. SYSU BS000544 TaxID=3416443 RepID=UPI003CE4F98F
MEEDIEWINQVLQGDVQSYTHIINKYKNKVFALMFRMVKRQEDAEDLTQECFIKAYNYLYSYNQEQAFSTWVCRIAINLCIDAGRKNKRINDHLQSNVDETVIADECSPEMIYLKKESENELQHLISELPESYRIVLLLRYIHELSCQEIGDILHLPANTVQVRLFRARVKLRECYQSALERRVAK